MTPDFQPTKKKMPRNAHLSPYTNQKYDVGVIRIHNIEKTIP